MGASHFIGNITHSWLYTISQYFARKRSLLQWKNVEEFKIKHLVGEEKVMKEDV